LAGKEGEVAEEDVDRAVSLLAEKTPW